MPIRINLLAEAQAAEEIRRRDPVKRATIVAGAVVLLFFLWSGLLQFRIIASSNELGEFEARWREVEQGYKAAVDSRRQSLETQEKLTALQKLTTNRFLLGAALNAFQQTLVGVDDVKVLRLRTDQTFTPIEEVKPAKGAVGAKPAGATERVVLTVDAVDSSPQSGGHYKFKEAIATLPYFQSNLQKTNAVLLTSLSAPVITPGSRNPAVTFTLQCYFAEKVR